MKPKLLISILFLLIICKSNFSQNFTQIIRGQILDKESKQPIAGANIWITESNPIIGTASDPDGYFRLANIPIGRIGLTVSSLSYKTQQVDNLLLNSAKEIVLEIELEQSVLETGEVTVTATGKANTINTMATVSSRMFTVEETEKYAGSRGDISRMAMNYAGVAAANDSRNDIIIRGNSPSGLLWKLDDIEIPNPNHFAENGTTGGPVGMLNNNLLMNSDFFTGAFPAEYANALSGVFDLKLRNGNNEKHEFLFQTGFNGFEGGIEGPISKKKKSSYMLNFRYSTLELVSKMVDLGMAGVPKYKDYCYKFNFPLKKGKLSIFGIGGWSEIAMLDSESDDQDLYNSDGQDLRNRSAMYANGISLMQILSPKTYLRFTASILSSEGGTNIDTFDTQQNLVRSLNHAYMEQRLSSNIMISNKINTKLTWKAGIGADVLGFNLNTEKYNANYKKFVTHVDNTKELFSGMTLYKAYLQASYKFTDYISLNPGISTQYLDFNKAFSVEPRIGFSWQAKPSWRVGLAYGRHSRMQTYYSYFFIAAASQNHEETNINLDFTRSNQIVLSNDFSLTPNSRLKAEIYYQNLINVPVETSPSSYSILNTGDGWGMDMEDSLQNTGTGKNYGIELTLERFFHKGFYYLTTLSLFDSKYKGSDKIERNTAFNGKYVWNFLIGKEFKIKEKSALAFDLKTTLAGGKRYTPLDLELSLLKDEARYLQSQAYSKQFDAFFKLDFKISYRLNGKRVSQEWQFYVENLTNHKNPLQNNYDSKTNEENIVYQLGIFPMMTYRIHF